MKTCAFILILIFCYTECRKVYAPIDKNANLAFINMESGGMRGGNQRPGSTNPTQAPVVAPIPTQKPTNPPPPTNPAHQPAPTTIKPAPPAKPAQPTPAPNQTKPVPNQTKSVPNQIKPVPANPSPVANPITTPGPGSVKQLINFYDSQGKASPIRPYSYSQAVKQG